jgi:hypothetical protein
VHAVSLRKNGGNHARDERNDENGKQRMFVPEFLEQRYHRSAISMTEKENRIALERAVTDVLKCTNPFRRNQVSRF